MGWNDLFAKIVVFTGESDVICHNDQVWGGPYMIGESMRDDMLSELGYDHSVIPTCIRMKIRFGRHWSSISEVLELGHELNLFPEQIFKIGDLVMVSDWIAGYSAVVEKIHGLKLTVRVTRVSEYHSRQYDIKAGEEIEVDVEKVRLVESDGDLVSIH